MYNLWRFDPTQFDESIELDISQHVWPCSSSISCHLGNFFTELVTWHPPSPSWVPPKHFLTHCKITPLLIRLLIKINKKQLKIKQQILNFDSHKFINSLTNIFRNCRWYCRQYTSICKIWCDFIKELRTGCFLPPLPHALMTSWKVFHIQSSWEFIDMLLCMYEKSFSETWVEWASARSICTDHCFRRVLWSLCSRIF